MARGLSCRVCGDQLRFFGRPCPLDPHVNCSVKRRKIAGRSRTRPEAKWHPCRKSGFRHAESPSSDFYAELPSLAAWLLRLFFAAGMHEVAMRSMQFTCDLSLTRGVGAHTTVNMGNLQALRSSKGRIFADFRCIAYPNPQK